ncbi:MAG: class I SAM-dependent methyltransferase [Candidatus Omnitrophota bacterium]
MNRVYYYEDDRLKIFESLARYEFARPYVKGAVVLDIGCGARKGPLLLSQNAKEVVGSDISKEAVSYCNRKWRAPNIKYLVSDALDLPFGDSVFDVVLAFEVLEHIGQQAQLLKEVRRILKKDGLFILSTPNRTIMSPQGVFQNPDHVREFDAAELKRLLSGVFSNVELYGQKPSSRVDEVLECRKRSYENVIRIPVFFRRFLPKSWRELLFKKYISHIARKNKFCRQEDISKSDFSISVDHVNEAHYLIALCRGIVNE